MIFENPDGLDYFTDQQMANRAFMPASLIICNDILSKDERDEIVARAIAAHEVS